MQSNKQQFSVPLYLTRGKKKPKNYWLNLNGYRNWKSYLSNDLKIQFKETIGIGHLKTIYSKVKVYYTFYYPDTRLRDLDNSTAVISKFTLDALVEANILDDDNYTIVIETRTKFGGIDKENPRCEIELIEVKD